MQLLYLIRHCTCEGDDEAPLNTLGKLQAYVLGRSLQEAAPSVIYYTGIASGETARDAAELCASETLEVKLHTETALSELVALLRRTKGNIAVCTDLVHIMAILNGLTSSSPVRDARPIQPFGSINKLCFEGDKLSILSYGEQSKLTLNEQDCLSLLKIANAPDSAIEAGKLAAEQAEQLADAIRGYIPVSRSRLRMAALLHRISEDPAQASNWLERLGFIDLGKSVACRLKLPEESLYMVTEPMLLFLALRLRDGEIEQYLSAAEPYDREQTEFVYDVVSSTVRESMARNITGE